MGIKPRRLPASEILPEATAPTKTARSLVFIITDFDKWADHYPRLKHEAMQSYMYSNLVA
jgi:hypothetical protein